MNYPQEKLTVGELFAATPIPGAKIRNASVPLGLTKDDVVYTIEPTGWCGEGKFPVAQPLTFTRYMYDRKNYGFGIHQYAMFRFPDGTERSLMKDQITKRSPRTRRGLLEQFVRLRRRMWESMKAKDRQDAAIEKYLKDLDADGKKLWHVWIVPKDCDTSRLDRLTGVA